MANTIIKHEFDLPLPDTYLVDHAMTQGKSRKYTYHGPDKIYLQIDASGKERYGPLTEDDKADGRPMPKDVKEFFEVDCTQYPLICQLRAPIVNESQEVSGPVKADNKTANTQTGDAAGSIEIHPQSPDLTGYTRYRYSLPILPDFIYDKEGVTVTNNVPSARVKTVNECILGANVSPDVTDLRMARDKMLVSSDSSITSDMPTTLSDKVKTYRQKLRDWPTLIETNGIPAAVALKMEPIHPDVVYDVNGVPSMTNETAAYIARREQKEADQVAAGLAQMEAAKPIEDQSI
tara:strand:- start:15291 stop:16163 length:873 start_codon:yes stop_codon:yes gene_type:complete